MNPRRPSRLRHERKAHLKRHYGITLHDYDVLLFRANGVCEICGRTEVEVSKRNKRLGVDHDHKNGHVRGLLCSICNRALAFMGDSSDRLRRAANYLDRADLLLTLRHG